MMRCLKCGTKIEDGVVCTQCRSKVDEEFCYKVAQCNYPNLDNEIWLDIISKMEKSYLFKEYSIDLAECIAPERRVYVKMKCMDMFMPSYLGVPKNKRDYVIEHAHECEDNIALSKAEKNYVRMLLFEAYKKKYDWGKIGDLPLRIELDKESLDPYLALAEYYIIIREYDKSEVILNKAKECFQAEEDVQRIEYWENDLAQRKNGTKKEWRPQSSDDFVKYQEYMVSLGKSFNPGEKKPREQRKVLEADFKPFIRYEELDIPQSYVAMWITSEFYMKASEVVEISALKIVDGKIKDRYHEYVHPKNTPKKPVHVKESDYMNAERISAVFPSFLEFAGDSIIAIAGFQEQKKLLSRLARYSMMDHLDNPVLDVVEFGEDLLDDDKIYTRESLLKKFEIKEGITGEEKAEATYILVEKMREWN